VLLVAAAGVAGLALHLRGQDPAAHFDARHGTLAAAEVGEATVEDGHVLQPVRVRSTSGLAVELLVKRPASGIPGPLVLILGGHNTGAKAATLIPDTQGHVVAALAYPYDGPHRIKGLQVLRWAPRIRAAMLDTPPAIELALDWLLAQPWTDASRVEAVGASLGVPFMTVAAARDARIGRLWAVQGGADSRALLAHNARRYLPGPVLPLGAMLADILVAGPYLTPERWIGRVAPRPVVLVNSTEDERIPRAQVEQLYAAAREPRDSVWLAGVHVMRRRPEVVRKLVTTVLERMEAEPLVPRAAEAGCAPDGSVRDRERTGADTATRATTGGCTGG
jgi:fermentation-respiration switch protein FrsA (DUF1100 family)